MVELAVLEKRYGATHRGFESLPLRHEKRRDFFVSAFFIRNAGDREPVLLRSKRGFGEESAIKESTRRVFSSINERKSELARDIPPAFPLSDHGKCYTEQQIGGI